MPVKHAEKRNMLPKQSIRRDDNVIVIAGKDKGKRGTVQRVLPVSNRAVVDGVNMVKRHKRRTGVGLQAGIIDMPAPISRANLMLICPNCNEPTRVGRSQLGDGTRVRVCKHCHEIIDKET